MSHVPLDDHQSHEILHEVNDRDDKEPMLLAGRWSNQHNQWFFKPATPSIWLTSRQLVGMVINLWCTGLTENATSDNDCARRRVTVLEQCGNGLAFYDGGSRRLLVGSLCANQSAPGSSTPQDQVYNWCYLPSTQNTAREAGGHQQQYMLGLLPCDFYSGELEAFASKQNTWITPLHNNLADFKCALSTWECTLPLSRASLPSICHEWTLGGDVLGKSALVQMTRALGGLPSILLTQHTECISKRTRVWHLTTSPTEMVPPMNTIENAIVGFKLGEPPMWWKAESKLWNSTKECLTQYQALTTTNAGQSDIMKVNESVKRGKISASEVALIREHKLVWTQESFAFVQEAPCAMREYLAGVPDGHVSGVCFKQAIQRTLLGNAWPVSMSSTALSGVAERWRHGGCRSSMKVVVAFFDGVGGTGLALDRLNVLHRVQTYVHIDKNPHCGCVVRAWWDRMRNTDRLAPGAILRQDITDVTDETGFWHTKEGWTQWLQKERVLTRDVLLTGGSPCNNISGMNRKTRDGIGGQHSKLFFTFASAATNLLASAQIK